MMHRVICDCDNTTGVPGRPIDDGQTLLYLLGRPDIELLGVTTTFGNGTIDQVHPATKQFLRDYGREEIPLHRGAGKRGQPPTEAAHFLAETAAAHPGEITLLALGPVGNLRAAAQLDPGFFGNLKQIVCMGGYLHSLGVPGWDHVPEINLSGDPEAAFAMINAACPFILMNAHICLQTPFGLEELAPVEQHDPQTYQVWRNYLLTCQGPHLEPKDYLWDLLPAVYISHPELFDDAQVWVRSTVADLEAGTIVVGDRGDGARITMPSRILDVERFYAIVNEAWAKAPAMDKSLRAQ
ncbi:MAG: nucleoside hydrolase [bacterium]|nr:nucleoside hydrolase [bacterium]